MKWTKGMQWVVCVVLVAFGVAMMVGTMAMMGRRTRGPGRVPEQKVVVAPEVSLQTQIGQLGFTERSTVGGWMIFGEPGVPGVTVQLRVNADGLVDVIRVRSGKAKDKERCAAVFESLSFDGATADLNESVLDYSKDNVILYKTLGTTFIAHHSDTNNGILSVMYGFYPDLHSMKKGGM